MFTSFYHTISIQSRGGIGSLWALVIGTLLLAGCAGSHKQARASQKFAPDLLQHEAQIVWDTYDACHPSLSWYTPHDSLQQAFIQFRQGITDSLTRQQFRMRLAEWVALINCGHTSVRPAKMETRGRYRGPTFPLQLKVLPGDSLVVLANGLRADSLLVRGAIVHQIQGYSSAKLIDTLSRFVSGDGYHNGFKHQLISNSFPGIYRQVMGVREYYLVSYTDTLGTYRTDTLRNLLPPKRDSSIVVKPDTIPRLPRLTAEQRRLGHRRLSIDTANNLSVMELNGFEKGKLRRFFRQSFRNLNSLGITNLAVELRQNGGGDITKSMLLTRYLTAQPFKIADTVAAKSFRFPYPGLVKNRFWYRLQKLLVTRKGSDGRFHYRYYEGRTWTAKKRNHFSGQVFIITGGITFSAASLFTHSLKGQPHVTVVGEETGGAAYGNTAINIPDVTLPHTGIRVRLPLYRMVTDRNLPKNGRGILPDMEVLPTSYHIRSRMDPKILKVYELIKERPRDKTDGNKTE